MESLIKALQIFLKYGNPDYPTNCSHEELMVAISPELVSEEDLKILEELSFIPNEYDGFISYKYGSC
jgi:hypothetical protein